MSFLSVGIDRHYTWAEAMLTLRRFFAENICTREDIVEANIRSVKISSPDVCPSWLTCAIEGSGSPPPSDSSKAGIRILLSRPTWLALPSTSVATRPSRRAITLTLRSTTLESASLSTTSAAIYSLGSSFSS